MYVDDNEKETLKVMGGETQKVELTSETFQDDVFDHYLVVKNPTVSNPSYFHRYFFNSNISVGKIIFDESKRFYFGTKTNEID